MGLLDILLGSSDSGKFNSGDWVYVIPDGEEGEVIDYDGDGYYTVELESGKVDTFREDELKRI